RRYADWFIRAAGQDGHQKGKLYRLVPAEGETPGGQSSAHPPQSLGSFSGSDAENAENAESISAPHAQALNTDPDWTLDADWYAEGGAKNPPHSPHPPHPDWNGGSG